MVRFWILETALLGYLIGVAGWMIWQTGGAAVDVEKGWEWLLEIREWEDWGSTVFSLILAAIFGIPIGLYWVFQARGMHRVSFWLVCLAALAPQMPAALSYNQVDWLSFWKYPMFTTEIPQYLVALLLLVSLLLLTALHRTADLRRLKGKLAELRLESREQGVVVRNEGLVLGAVAGGSLGITGTLLMVGMGVSQFGGTLGQSPWPVVSIGAAVMALLAMVVALWLRQVGAAQPPTP